MLFKFLEDRWVAIREYIKQLMMKKPLTKGDYKRKTREVKRTSQRLAYPKYKFKFKKDDIVRLDGGEDMGYVQYYVYNKVLVKWSDNSTDYYDESLLKKVL